MTYLNEETRTAYHKSSALLQMICSIFEGSLFRHGLQVEVIDAEKDKAFVGVMDIEPDLAKEIVFQINKQFKRRDGHPTATFENADYGTFTFYVTESQDFVSNH